MPLTLDHDPIELEGIYAVYPLTGARQPKSTRRSISWPSGWDPSRPGSATPRTALAMRNVCPPARHCKTVGRHDPWFSARSRHRRASQLVSKPWNSTSGKVRVPVRVRRLQNRLRDRVRELQRQPLLEDQTEAP